MRAVGKGHARDGCTAHRETVCGLVFHFKERGMNGVGRGLRDEREGVRRR